MNTPLQRIFSVLACVAILTGCGLACAVGTRPTDAGPRLATAAHRCCATHAPKPDAAPQVPADRCPLCRACPLAGTLPIDQPDHRTVAPPLPLLAILPPSTLLAPTSTFFLVPTARVAAVAAPPPTTLLDLFCASNT